MEVEYLKKEKNEAEIELDNLTAIELIKVYLTKDKKVKFAAWKRKHHQENPVLKIKTKGKSVKKAIKDAVKNIEKDLDELEKNFKKISK